MRKFEKISFEQFKKDISDNLELYNSYSLPRRKTKSAGGYDIFSLIDYELKPKEAVVISTGMKCNNPADEIFVIVNRSSLGFKHGIKLANQVGIIDADYYNNKDNDGHIFVCLQNEGDKVIEIKKGDRFVQGIFIPYLVTDDDATTDLRKGGIGSTNNKGDDL